MDQLTRLEIPFVLLETSESLPRELLNDKVLAIQGDAKHHDIPRPLASNAREASASSSTTTATTLHYRYYRYRQGPNHRYAQAMRNSGADEVIIPEYEGGLMTGPMISKYYPVPTNLE